MQLGSVTTPQPRALASTPSHGQDGHTTQYFWSYKFVLLLQWPIIPKQPTTTSSPTQPNSDPWQKGPRPTATRPTATCRDLPLLPVPTDLPLLARLRATCRDRDVPHPNFWGGPALWTTRTAGKRGLHASRSLFSCAAACQPQLKSSPRPRTRIGSHRILLLSWSLRHLTS